MRESDEASAGRDPEEQRGELEPRPDERDGADRERVGGRMQDVGPSVEDREVARRREVGGLVALAHEVDGARPEGEEDDRENEERPRRPHCVESISRPP